MIDDIQILALILFILCVMVKLIVDSCIETVDSFGENIRGVELHIVAGVMLTILLYAHIVTIYNSTKNSKLLVVDAAIYNNHENEILDYCRSNNNRVLITNSKLLDKNEYNDYIVGIINSDLEDKFKVDNCLSLWLYDNIEAHNGYAILHNKSELEYRIEYRHDIQAVKWYNMEEKDLDLAGGRKILQGQ